MRLTTTLLLLIAFLMMSAAFAEETDNQKSAGKKEYKSLESALKSGKPVFCLFHTSKACKCTMRRCGEVLVLSDSIANSFGEDIVYYKVDIAVDDDIVRNYKIIAAPTAIFFDKKGAEYARLQSWEITPEIISTKTAELLPKKKGSSK